jgi:hypothetical protein
MERSLRRCNSSLPALALPRPQVRPSEKAITTPSPARSRRVTQLIPWRDGALVLKAPAPRGCRVPPNNGQTRPTSLRNSRLCRIPALCRPTARTHLPRTLRVALKPPATALALEAGSALTAASTRTCQLTGRPPSRPAPVSGASTNRTVSMLDPSTWAMSPMLRLAHPWPSISASGATWRTAN